MSNSELNSDRLNYDLLLKTTDLKQRLSVLNSINDEEILSDIIVNVEDQEIRLEAIKRIHTQEKLSKITERNCGKAAGFVAVDNISEEVLLEHVAKNASNKKVRTYALEKLNAAQVGEENVAKDSTAQGDLPAMYQMALKLSESWNWEYAENKLTEIRQAWKEVDPEEKHELFPNFVKATKHFFTRFEEFKVRQTEEEKRIADRNDKIARLTSLCKAAEDLAESPVDNGEGQISELKLEWQKHGVVPKEVFEELEYRFTRACQKFIENKQRLEQERIKHKEMEEILETLYVKAENLAKIEDLQGAESQLKKLRKDWDEVFIHSDKFDEMGTRFEEVLVTINARIKDWKRKKEKEYQENLEHLDSLCKRVAAEVDAEDRRDAQQQVLIIQNEWKDLLARLSLRTKDKSTLQRQFRENINRFYDRQKEYKDHREWEQWANLMLKEDICKELEARPEDEDPFKIAGILKEMRHRWKNIGHVPRENSDRIWNRYKSVCDHLHERCKTFFEELDKEQEQNWRLKEEICGKIEEINASGNFTDAFQEIKKLQSDWYETGHVPKNKEKEAAKRFKRACDHYFDARRSHFKDLRKSYADNLKTKQTLCEQVEALLDVGSRVQGIETIKKLNEEWKKIGAIPGKKDSELWTRFRKGCDKFFENLDAERPQNLTKKEELIVKIEEILQKVKGPESQDLSAFNELAKEIIALQKRWKEIGHVPKEQEKEIWERFLRPCDEFFDLRRRLTQENEKIFEEIISKKQCLLSELEELTSSSELSGSGERVDHILSEWNKLGKVPTAEDRKLGITFREICSQFFENKKRNLKERKQEQSRKIKQKEELCLRMEMLGGTQKNPKGNNTQCNLSLSEQLQLAFESNFISSASASVKSNHKPNIQNQIDEAQRIQKAWKEIGFVFGKQNKQLNERFKMACDLFFSRSTKKKPSVSKEELEENLHSKIKICERLEGYAESQEPSRHLAEVKKYQKNWKTIGQVPSKKVADELWSRYNAACDKIFQFVREQRENVSS